MFGIVISPHMMKLFSIFLDKNLDIFFVFTSELFGGTAKNINFSFKRKNNWNKKILL
ncbi:unnamed protein product [Meloidogyne enterolobii]|uniref:Uncharacterized protein n=1 Tax=Meloidogyne enterolobii TaxID=390850 RepID=A0ACB1B4Z7_MELEN